MGPQHKLTPMLDKYKADAVSWLGRLIEIPSLSRTEQGTADFLFDTISEAGYQAERLHHNVWLKSRNWQDQKPTILLCSHHDTVKPGQNWTKPPFKATLEQETLFGLGSNDAGGSLMALLAVFRYFEALPAAQPFNLIYAAVAEEEVSGQNGISALLPHLPKFDLAIIGEPTRMQMAIAEKGLMVIDGVAKGKTGHAARDEGINAIYIALEDILKIQNLSLEKVSPFLGSVKISVTQIEAGYQHNVVPDTCSFVIDVRTNELYSNQEVYQILQAEVQSTLTPRSFRLNSSRIDPDHPIVQRGLQLGLTTYGSPTLSDQAQIPGPTIKIGCGDSARSHTPDEFIQITEIYQGIDLYISLLKELIIG